MVMYVTVSMFYMKKLNEFRLNLVSRMYVHRNLTREFNFHPYLEGYIIN